VNFKACTILTVLCALLHCSRANAVTADAAYIPCREYFSTLTARINGARSSVVAAIYLFALYSDKSEAQTTQLADALAAARKRGCKVRVVLDKNDPTNASPASDVVASNHVAYEYLKAHDIDVYFADVPATMHAKAVIIDSATVIVGSANWSDAAFQKNTEAGALIQSREVALAALAELGGIKALAMQDHDTTAARVPVKFLTDTTYLGRMVSGKGKQFFDVYLYLLSQFYLRPSDSMLVMDYKPLIHYLGMDSLTLRRSRGNIKVDLEKLQNRFKLIKMSTHYGKDAEIWLEPMAGDYVAVPSGYFKWNWYRELDLPGKVMELLSLYYSSISPDRPKWSLGIRAIAERHGIAHEFISRGTEELRRKNLLDVEHFELPRDSEDFRHPNVYMPLPLYDPAVLAAKWVGLEAKYGKEKTDRARKCAGLVFKDCDPVAVEVFIDLEKQYGIDRMEQASKIIMAMEADNPKRTFEFFKGIVKKLGPIQ
jgi:hypothetical protein